MSPMAAIFIHNPSLIPHFSISRQISLLCRPRAHHGHFPAKRAHLSDTHLAKSSHFRIRSFLPENAAGSEFSPSSNDALLGGVEANEMLFRDQKDGVSDNRSSYLAKFAFGLGLAVTITVLSIFHKQQTPGSSLGVGIQRLSDVSSSSSLAASSTGFAFNVCGYRVVLPEYTPGWVYFWLLMTAACGLFISEEALNIWVGISLARKLCLDGTWQSFAESFSTNAPYIISTVLWVYWGVCISDLIPFYVGKLFRQTGASDDLCSKLGIRKEKLMNITRAVQRYGNLSGFVERFSIGVRNPTAFLAGAMGVSPDCFFNGVCCGGLITLSIQGIWTMFPYAVAAVTSLYFFFRHRYSSS